MIFIAHSRHDQEVTGRVEAALRERGHRTWVDFSRIPVSERFVQEIANGFGQSSAFLLVASASSSSSYWVSREVACAARLRKAGRLAELLCLRLDGTPPLDVPMDHCFSNYESVLHHLDSHRSEAPSLRMTSDPHQVDVTYYHAPPEPRVWLGFSGELSAIDRWFFESEKDLWISGLGGAGKSSLVLVWLAALRLIGYQQPLDVSIRQWSFYEEPDASLALEELTPWIQSGRYSSKLLLVDGIDEFQSPPVHEVCELGMRYPEIAIIITSRRSVPDRYSGHFDEISLSALKKEDATLLLGRLGVGRAEVDQLYNLLQGHPLTMSIASSMLEQGNQIEDLLRTLQPKVGKGG